MLVNSSTASPSGGRCCSLAAASVMTNQVRGSALRPAYTGARAAGHEVATTARGAAARRRELRTSFVADAAGTTAVLRLLLLLRWGAVVFLRMCGGV